ncbi:MAG: non-canonical purine NTP pyrophosphatase [Bradymonadaceae bacterium]
MDVDNVLLFATGNPHKRQEFERLLGDFLHPMWETYDLTDWPEALPEVEETRETFRGNAFQKAETMSLATQATALADDSGLEVDALDGAPGVRSARFAGPDATDEQNNKKLIEELQGVSDRERTARYVCVIALVASSRKVGRALIERTGYRIRAIPEAKPTEEATLARADDRAYVWFRGTVEGKIIDEPRGDHGFGYDPHFYVPEWDKTMAEVPMDKKNEISHRAEALRKMKDFFPATSNP